MVHARNWRRCLFTRLRRAFRHQFNRSLDGVCEGCRSFAGVAAARVGGTQRWSGREGLGRTASVAGAREAREHESTRGVPAEGARQSAGAARAKLNIKILRQHDHVAELISRVHRFRAVDRQGLFALAKDLARITADDIDEREIQTLALPPKGERWGSLKSLEKLLATRMAPDEAHAMLSPLVGVYELRLANAHLPSNDVADALRLIGIDEASPFAVQGYQLLDAAVAAIYRICGVIEAKW